MSADQIAKVIGDLRTGRVAKLADCPDTTFDAAVQAAQTSCDRQATLIDATAVYQDLMHPSRGPVLIYDDHIVVPPAKRFSVAYTNVRSNTILMAADTVDVQTDPPEQHPEWLTRAIQTGEDPPGWRDMQGVDVPEHFVGDHKIDWSSVRWCISVLCFVGGRSDGQPAPTQGPSCAWIILATGDGEPIDIHWVLLTESLTVDAFQTPGLVLLGALNLLSCTNVTAEEPVRSRAESRRLARAGVTLKVLTVKPTGKRTASGRTNPEPVGVRLTSVRGHFAHYGACCPTHEPRGLLFGKLTGRYYVPQHARGSEEVGEIHKTYELALDSHATIEP